MRARQPPAPWEEVAREEGISSRQAKTIHTQYLSSGDDLDAQPLDVLGEHLAILGAAMEDAAETATRSAPGSTVRVGALRLMVECSTARIATMQALGLLGDLSALARERDLQALFGELGEILDRPDVPQDVLRAVLELAQSLSTRPSVRALPA